VTLAATARHRAQPQRVLGKNLFWWADHLGLLDLPYTSPLANYLLRGDTFPGKHLELKELRRSGVRVEGRLVRVVGGIATFQNGKTVTPDVVVWATGYQEDDSVVNIPYAKDASGALLHTRGVTPAPGLFAIGRSWQWTRGSALLHGVGKDAEFITRMLGTYLDEMARAGMSMEGAAG
jgi:putative flavoprotein involved in K+ transport